MPTKPHRHRSAPVIAALLAISLGGARVLARSPDGGVVDAGAADEPGESLARVRAAAFFARRAASSESSLTFRDDSLDSGDAGFSAFRTRDGGLISRGGLSLEGGPRPLLEPIVSGSLTRDIIRRVVQGRRQVVNACLDQLRVDGGVLVGEMMVKFLIDGAGGVSESKLEWSALGNAVLEDCVVASMRALTFPAPSDGGVVIVKYPFVFPTVK